MPVEEFRFYTEDSCALKSDPSHIGVIERTFHDVLTHDPDPLSIYTDGISRGKGVPSHDYRQFLHSGAPPRGTVLFSSAQSPKRWQPETLLLRERDLILLDRALLVGDVVKKSPRDAASGTVTQTRTRVSLIQPKLWPGPCKNYAHVLESYHGNYSSNSAEVLFDIDASDLILPSGTDSEGFIIWKDWVGKISATEADIAVRLSNGSVVVVEMPHDLEFPEVNEYCEVNDFVRASRKANLRRGRWIFGAYDPNIEPEGFVVDVRITALSVDWLYQSGNTDMPSDFIDSDMLENEGLHFCNRRRQADSKEHDEKSSIRTEIGSEITVGDRCRLKDGTSSERDLQRISRSEALGYDINVYLVAKTETEVTVLWQDLTTSVLSSVQLCPHLDLDNEEEVWPGEIIIKRDRDEWLMGKQTIGVVQSVNAAERIAKVKWFENTSMQYDSDGSTLRGGDCGILNPEVHDVSLYDVHTTPSLTKRIGDYVAVNSTLLFDGHEPDMRDLFGEVVHLGLEGLLTLRMCGKGHTPRFKVPWFGASLVFSPDMEHDDIVDDMEDGSEEEDDGEEDEEEDDENYLNWESDISDGGTRTSRNSKLLKPKTRELTDGEDGEEEWQTEDESQDDEDEEEDEDRKERDNYPEEDNMDLDMESSKPAEPPKEPKKLSDVSYELLFAEGKPALFEILQAVPNEHHYSDTRPSQGTKRLKRIQKEYGILASSLPHGVWVRTWEGRLDLLRILILGPVDTPYEYAPFFIDLHLDEEFPDSPPRAFFHSWTNGTGAINPNLYEDGTICLSLLGTWHSDKSEAWSTNSTILQVIISILGLVLVQEPYFNEAGYEVRRGSADFFVNSKLYSERAYLNSRNFIFQALREKPDGFDSVLYDIYEAPDQSKPQLLQFAIIDAVKIARRSALVGLGGAGVLAENDKDGAKVSAGALSPLCRQIEKLILILARSNGEKARELLMDVFGKDLADAELDRRLRS